MSTRSLIRSNLSLGPNELIIYLEQLPDQPQTYAAIAQLMLESTMKQQQQKLATSFNFLIERAFKRQDKNPELWQLYLDLIGTRVLAKEEGSTGWGVTKILERSFARFVESFQQQFTPIFQQVYFKLNFHHRIFVQALIPRGSIDDSAKYPFLSETLLEYIGAGLHELESAASMPADMREQALRTVTTEYLQSLVATMQYLCIVGLDSKEYHALGKRVSHAGEMFELMAGAIERFRDDKKSMYSQSADYKVRECYNNIRALGFQLFDSMLNFHYRKSTIQDFDQLKTLNMMENMVPALVKELGETKTNVLQLDYNAKLTIAILCLIKRSTKFIFMGNYFWSNYKAIVWEVLYPLLAVSGQEMRDYEHEPDLFVAQSETIVEKDEHDEKMETCKSYASFLLEALADQVDGLVTYVVESVLGLMESILDNRRVDQAQEIIQSHKIKPSLETCLTVLTTMSSRVQKRRDLLPKILGLFLKHQGSLLGLTKVDKARLIFYLSYNFDEIFRQSAPSEEPAVYAPEARFYYQLVADSLEQSEAITKCCLMFCQTFFNLEPAATIMIQRLFELIERTENVQILDTATRALFGILPALNHTKAVEILVKLLDRIQVDNQKYIKSLRQREESSNICLLKCLNSVKVIAEFYSARDESEEGTEIMGIVWRVFDLMDFICEANYGEDLLRIFDIVLEYPGSRIAGSHFFQFLPVFGDYHRKEKEMGRLFWTYLILLENGEQFLKNDQEGGPLVRKILQNALVVVSMGLKTQSVVAVNLIQYIMIKFPLCIDNHEEIYCMTEELLESTFKYQREGTCGVLNLWVAGSIYSRAYNLARLEGVPSDYFNGYQARMFAIVVGLKIEFLCQQIRSGSDDEREMVREIIFLFAKTASFLKCFEEKRNPTNSQVSERVKQFYNVSPSEKIREAVILIKKTLKEGDYQDLMHEVEKEVSRKDLQAMLNKISKNSRVILAFK